MWRTYRTKDWTLKAKARTKDFFRVLKESLRPGPRPRTNITDSLCCCVWLWYATTTQQWFMHEENNQSEKMSIRFSWGVSLFEAITSLWRLWRRHITVMPSSHCDACDACDAVTSLWCHHVPVAMTYAAWQTAWLWELRRVLVYCSKYFISLFFESSCSLSSGTCGSDARWR